LFAWSFLKFLSSEDKEDNQMVFTFEDMKDLSRVLDISPWNINGTPLFLKYWDNVSTYSDIDFSTAAFWVQVHGLPLDMMSEKNARSIGSCLGDLLEIDDAYSGQFCRKSFLMLRLFRRKMVSVVKWFQGSHFSGKYFSPKAFFGVWHVHKITNIFHIFIQSY
jgi:hypothetical protein